MNADFEQQLALARAAVERGERELAVARAAVERLERTYRGLGGHGQGERSGVSMAPASLSILTIGQTATIIERVTGRAPSYSTIRRWCTAHGIGEQVRSGHWIVYEDRLRAMLPCNK